MNVLNSVDLVPPDHRAFVGQKFFLVDILWVQNIFRRYFVGLNFSLWVFRASEIFTRGHFVGPKVFLVGISWIQNFI